MRVNESVKHLDQDLHLVKQYINDRIVLFYINI